MNDDNTGVDRPHRQLIIDSLPLPLVLSSLVADYCAVEEDRCLLERDLRTALLLGRRRRGTSNEEQLGQKKTVDSNEATSSSSSSSSDVDRSPVQQASSDSERAKVANVLLSRLLSHSEFPRHRCSHLLILLEAAEDKPDGEYEISRAVAAGGVLAENLDPIQLQQWQYLTDSGFIEPCSSPVLPKVDDTKAQRMRTMKDSSPPAMPLAASLHVIRLESQRLNCTDLDQFQRLLVSCLSWQPLPSLYHSGIPHKDTDEVSDYASVAWPTAGFFQRFEYNGPFERGQLPISESYPEPTSKRLLADIFPLDAPKGPFLYSRVSGLYREDNATGEIEDQHFQADSVYLLDATHCLENCKKQFQVESRWDTGGVEAEHYLVRDCVGVIIQLPSAPPVETIADAKLIREQLNQLAAVHSRRDSQAMYDLSDDSPFQCPSFSFAATALRLEQHHLEQTLANIQANLGISVSNSSDNEMKSSNEQIAIE